MNVDDKKKKTEKTKATTTTPSNPYKTSEQRMLAVSTAEYEK